MAKIDHGPSISYLNHKAFKECRRQWLFRYEPDVAASGQEFWELKRQGNLLPSSALLGRVVDDAITAALRHRLREGKWPNGIGKAVERVMVGYLRFSAEWVAAALNRDRWPKSKQRQAVDRFYYNSPLTEHELTDLRRRAQQLVERWFELPLRSELDSLPTETWRVPESGVIPSFELEGMKVYAKYDFMTVEPGRLRIYDWKTGDVANGEQGAIEQLHGYAIFAHREWGVPYEDMELIAVWLSANYLGRTKVDMSLVARLERAWRHQIGVVAEGLRMVGSGEADIDAAFPTTTETWRCQGCIFRACARHPKAIGNPPENVG
ncbi:MAG: PD-(D/E)XK nuclease family protein [Armatimonadetes bacterium]|nr:PD-(D/E)XK nuclease family protein [Armatimonadota bacterium]